MRVGKTPQAILAAHKAGARSISVVTRAIAVPQWKREILRWWQTGDVCVEVLSYERATELWKLGLRGKADVFIPDECHFAMNPEAQRTAMVYGKTGFAWHAGAVWALSGTPAPRHAGQLWPMLRAFGVVKATYDDFVRHYCVYDFERGRVVGTKEKFIPELKAMLATIMLRRMRKDVAPEMPDIGYEFLEVEPQGTDLEVPPGLTDEQLLAWVETNRGDREDRQAVALAKVPPLVDEIVFAIKNGLLKQTVVFGWHIEPLMALVRELRAQGIEAEAITGATVPAYKEKIQTMLREGRTQVLAANILTAGTAIDLSCVRHGYFLELDWTSGNNVQAANRMVSMEKTDKVTCDVVTWRGSHDDRVQRVLMRQVRQLAQLY